MPLALGPVVEADLPEISKIEYAAFASFPLNDLLYTNGYTKAIYEDGLKIYQSRFARPNSVIWKVVDTELDSKIVAFGIWIIVREDQSPHEAGATAFLGSNAGNDVNEHVLRAFLESNQEAKRRIIKGRKRVHVSLICTLPEQQGRGAGKMLLQKGIEIADKEGLDLWVVASAYGLPLYQKVGFEIVEGGTINLDLEALGGKGVQVNKIMMRRLSKTAEH